MRIPSKIFGIQKVKEEVINIWSASPSSDDPIQVLEEKIINSSHALQKAAREELVRCRSQLQRLRKAVTSAQKLTQVYPHCSWAKDRLQEATRVLQEIRQQREQFLFRKSAAQWAVKGDKVNREFFLTKTPKRRGTHIHSLKREDDSMTFDQEEILQMATNYYRDLLAPTLTNDPPSNLMHDVITCLKTRIGEAAKAQLSKDIGEEEIVAGLDKIHSMACLGVDGLPKAFFKEFWEQIFPSLKAGLQEMWRTGRMPSSFNEGLIYLIPKSETTLHEIKQWRPITILNLIYKKFANILVQRIKPFLGDIIQSNQTGFMEHRSIMDNVILFWEAVATARETNQNLACLMLDFEKAYDRVQWSFLEEVMKVIELPLEWRCAAQALYRNGSSKVLIAGRKGARIFLTRSIRQGCPLAPFLFLFITEAMSAFFNSQGANLHGLSIPNSRKSLLDSEFADDTMLYLQGNEANLERAQSAIDLFCKASGASINWNKSKGFWISSESNPLWKPNAEFKWIAKGEATRYLGTWIGVDIDKGIQMQQIQSKICDKIRNWSGMHLSLAGRIIVANHVLLSTLWHAVSVWMFDKQAIRTVKACIRGFLWAGMRKDNAAAKVAWSTLVLPKSKGGLGLIDPGLQSQALLCKVLVRSLLPGNELWKTLIHNRSILWSPRLGGQWKSHKAWPFCRDLKLRKSNRLADRTCMSVMQAWSMLRGHLSRNRPSTSAEWMRQPLLWNETIHSPEGTMLGQSKRMPWAILYCLGIHSVADWRRLSGSNRDKLFEDVGKVRNGRKMLDLVNSVVCSLPIGNEEEGEWSGQCDDTGKIINVRGLGKNGKIVQMGLIDESACWYPIRIVARDGKKWKVNPPVEEAEEDWVLYAVEGKPLECLEWDPAEFTWKGEQDKPLSFFEYSTCLGRKLGSYREKCANKWAHAAVDSVFVDRTRSRIWNSSLPERIKVFFWLITHRAVPTGEWLGNRGGMSGCKACNASLEDIAHCLWCCPRAQEIWLRSLRILARFGVEVHVSSATVTWLATQSASWFHRWNGNSPSLKVMQGSVQPAQGGSFVLQERYVDIWLLVVGLTVWQVWVSRCKETFTGKRTPPAENLMMIWFNLISTLRGQFESLQGSSDTSEEARARFLLKWSGSSMLQMVDGEAKWNYQPPRWLFPPSVPNI